MSDKKHQQPKPKNTTEETPSGTKTTVVADKDSRKTTDYEMPTEKRPK